MAPNMIYLLAFALGFVAGAIILHYRTRREAVMWRVIDLDKEKP